jgi:hypothetical protein
MNRAKAYNRVKKLSCSARAIWPWWRYLSAVCAERRSRALAPRVQAAKTTPARNMTAMTTA